MKKIIKFRIRNKINLDHISLLMKLEEEERNEA